MTLCIHPTARSAVKQGVPAAVLLRVLQFQWCSLWALLHSEVVGCQTSVVNVENQAGIVDGGIKHLQRGLQKKEVIYIAN